MVGRGASALALAGMLAAATPALADRALVIGIDSYADERLAVAGTSSGADAAAIIGLLTGSLGYAPADVKTLLNADATREAIIAAFEDWLIAGTKDGERAFFYFSGLGYFQPDEDGDESDGLDETFVPFDATVGGGEPPTVAGMISDDEISALIGRLDGRSVTVAVDAGHSGLVSRQPATATGDGGVRAAALGGKTRAIVVEPAAKAQKAEGAPLDTAGLGGDVAVFTATSGGQAPLIEDGAGAFTKAFVDAIREKGADANGNGIVSNAEILAFVRDKSKAACAEKSACELGLTPTLGPATASGGTPAKEEAAAGGDKLTADAVLDFFAKGNNRGVTLEQIPASPVPLGTKNIRFRVTSPEEGSLVLLDLADDGTLTQLFPNQFTRKTGREAQIRAGGTITVPDDYYGIQFNASSANKGTLIALVTAEPIELPEAVKTRKIEVIPKAEAKAVFLPAIAEALDKPADTDADSATRSIDFSVAVLRYEILDH
jgi:acetyl esterase/lipase